MLEKYRYIEITIFLLIHRYFYLDVSKCGYISIPKPGILFPKYKKKLKHIHYCLIFSNTYFVLVTNCQTI